MKAEDLRIGNLALRQGFLIEDKDKYRKTIVNVNDIAACQLNPSSFKPIPLTEEWLLKFGFEQENGIMSWIKEDVKIVYETLANYYRLYPRINKIQYVHQLQNLYFALTNLELTLEP